MSRTVSAISAIAPFRSFTPQARQWVQLRDRCSDFSFDQALLMCQATDGSWLAWVPDYGEVVLHRHQFFKA